MKTPMSLKLKKDKINQNQSVKQLMHTNHFNLMKFNCFFKLSTAKNAVFHLFCSNVKTFAKTHLQPTDTKSDNKPAVSIRSSRKAVKTKT